MQEIDCPYCGNHDVIATVEWKAKSLDPHDSENVAYLTEWVCRKSQDHVFWLPTNE